MVILEDTLGDGTAGSKYQVEYGESARLTKRYEDVEFEQSSRVGSTFRSSDETLHYVNPSFVDSKPDSTRE